MKIYNFTEKEVEVLGNIILKYGEIPQKMIAMEELSELQKEISKNARGHNNVENLIEEIADTIIMIEQIKMMCDISSSEIQEEIHKKITLIPLK